MSPGVVGRDVELGSLRSFASSIPAGVVALALEGEAGVGKTTLWEAGVADARAGELGVLVARPAESETTLSFSGVGDLLEPVLDEALEPLSTAQRRALSRALVLGDDDGPPPDPHAIGLALLNALRSLSEARPLVVAIDDVQWLDAASAGGLAYAMRRLRKERVGVLLARRSGLESSLLTAIRRSFPADRLTDVDVGPLDSGALHQVLRSHLGTVLPRPLLDEVRDASGGNPLYALEIVRMLQRRGVQVDAGQPLPVPESLRELVHGRLLALPRESRAFLLAAAAYAYPTIEVTEAASAVDRDTALPPALDARVVELDGTRIRFTHPLLAAGAYETADRRRQAEVHARLAELLDDPEARAWQLAASVESPDEAVAQTLEQGAGHARRRGALRAAALMLERAGGLTSPDRPDEALRRAVGAAYLHFESGDSHGAESRLRDLIAPLPPGPQRAKAMVVLARIRLYEAPDEADELFGQVVRETRDDRETLVLAHEGIAACSLYLFEGYGRRLRHAEIAYALARELGDEALVADVLTTRLPAEMHLGRTSARATAAEAQAAQAFASDRRLLDQPLISLAEYWTWVDAYEPAREALGDLMRRAHDLGDENSLPWLLCLLGDLERLTGDLEAALRHAREGHEAAVQSGQPLFALLNLARETLVHAQLGHPETTRQSADRALQGSSVTGVRLIVSEALGHLSLASGAPGGTVAHLAPSLAFARRESIEDPTTTRFAIDLVEALIELGERDDALSALDWYEGNAVRLERASARASSLRCRGLLSAQAGELAAAVVSFDEALSWHGLAELPLDRARTLLALGMTQRRANRRREARATLEHATAVFEQIGALLWAARARAELGRISGRAPALGALTPAEERVAAHVAEGKTNREVAAALFLSERTVEGHLSRIFGKLGIRQRGELARTLATRQSQGIERSNTGDSPVSADPAAP